MRRPRLGLFALVIASTWLLPTAAPASAATTTDVTQRYHIAATLDYAAGRLDAVETLTLTNRASHPIDHLNLSVIPRALGYLVADPAVRADEKRVSTAWTTTTNLRIDFARRLYPGRTTEITIQFGLNIGTSRDAFSARLSRENGVISLGEWFPIVSREHDSYGVGDPQVSFNAERIRLDLTTTAPLPRHSVACAGLVERPPQDTGTRWTCEAENVRDFSFVVNPNFVLTERTAGDTALRVYSQTTDGGITADLAQAALIGLNETFGTYPWPDLVLAEVGASGGFSMEFPRTIHLTRTKATDTYVVFHEVAHQWFYGQLGNDQQREPWLDEGFSDFSARYLMGIGEDHCSRRDVDSPVFAWPADLISGGDWTSCDGYFHTVFYKGTEFLNGVRASMGDEAFFSAMRDFLARNRYGVVTSRQLLDHLQEWSPTDPDLVPIYRTYLSRYDQPFAKRFGTAAERPGP